MLKQANEERVTLRLVPNVRGKSNLELAREHGVDPSTMCRRIRAVGTELAVLMPRRARFDPHAEAGQPGSWTWSSLPWEHDPWAREFVARNPHGAGQAEVAQAMGVTRQRLEQIESAAKRKLRKLCGIELEEFVGGLE